MVAQTIVEKGRTRSYLESDVAFDETRNVHVTIRVALQQVTFLPKERVAVKVADEQRIVKVL